MGRINAVIRLETNCELCEKCGLCGKVNYTKSPVGKCRILIICTVVLPKAMEESLIDVLQQHLLPLHF